MDLTATAKNCFMELNELIELRDGAYENTRIYKERTKRWHDSRLQGDKNFKAGDKIAIRKSVWNVSGALHSTKGMPTTRRKVPFLKGQVCLSGVACFKLSVIQNYSASRDKFEWNQFILIIADDGYASFLGVFQPSFLITSGFLGFTFTDFAQMVRKSFPLEICEYKSEEQGSNNRSNIGLRIWITRLNLNNRRLDVFGASVIRGSIVSFGTSRIDYLTFGLDGNNTSGRRRKTKEVEFDLRQSEVDNQNCWLNWPQRHWGHILLDIVMDEPTRLQDAIRIANNLMDQKLKGYAARNAKNKRRFRNSPRDNRVQQPPLKGKMLVSRMWQGRTRLGTAGRREGGHMARDCRTVFAATAQRALVENQRVVTCFGCGGQGHHKSDCPKLKNQNRGNKAANNETRGRAYALGGGDGNPDSNIVTGTFLLNNRYAYILFDSGVDRSFVSTTFSALIDITHTALDVSYAVELLTEGLSNPTLLLGVVR
ncbi:putative reverse transcriptase domain-containing protein [Tanacetum coccineum]